MCVCVCVRFIINRTEFYHLQFIGVKGGQLQGLPTLKTLSIEIFTIE